MKKNRSASGFKGQYTACFRSTMDTDAWRALSPTAQALFPWLRMEWKGAQRNNNGKLCLSYRNAANAMGIAKADTVGKAFRELQAKGFVVVHQNATLGMDGLGKSFEFEITDIDMPGKRQASRRFLEWSPGNDFEVKSANVNNPSGAGQNALQKTKSHPGKRDTPVPFQRTKLQTLSFETGHPIPRNGTV